MKNQSVQMATHAANLLQDSMAAVLSQTQSAAVMESTAVPKDTPVMFQLEHATKEAVLYLYYKRFKHSNEMPKWEKF